MVTKWKRSKAVLGFLSFALGVSLLLANGLPLVQRLSSAEGRTRLDDLRAQDLQQTASFRNYLSNLMNRFLAMGAGGPLDNYYGYYDGDLMQGVAVTSVAEDWLPYASEEEPPSESDKARWKQQAEAYHRSIQDDKNILYEIRRGTEVLYTNCDGPYSHSNLPSGYGTALSFENGNCRLTLHGEPVALYGEDNNDLYVDDGRHWYLPGYVNFPAGKETAGLSIFLAVADRPAIYVQGNYSSSTTRWQDNSLYWLEQRWQQDRRALRDSIVLLAVGCLLLAAAFLLRRDKARADRAIAAVTGRLWFELKLLALIAALAAPVWPFGEEMTALLHEVVSTYIYGGWGFEPWFWEEYLYQILRRPSTLLLAFWVAYLFVNDLRYGSKPWRHGICGMLRAKELKLPIQKRLSRRAGLVAAILLLLALTVLVLSALVLGASVSLALTFAVPTLLLAALGVWATACKGQRQFWRDIGLLTGQISAVKAGDLTAPIPISETSDLYVPSQDLARIGQGMEEAVAEQTRSERMRVELITNVSHDLKTPLTSILSYAELLRQEDLVPPARDYVEILCQKAERLRAMVLDVFEVSKAASGELPIKPERLDLSKLLQQTLADLQQSIDAAPITLRQNLPETPVPIVADGQRLYRVFQNLIQNALQYALEGSRIYLDLTVQNNQALASIKNTSKTELPAGVDFTARFVRGDPSRTDGGSGLGLAIAESFTTACGGTLTVEPVADLFVVTVRFPLAADPEA